MVHLLLLVRTNAFSYNNKNLLLKSHETSSISQQVVVTVSLHWYETFLPSNCPVHEVIFSQVAQVDALFTWKRTNFSQVGAEFLLYRQLWQLAGWICAVIKWHKRARIYGKSFHLHNQDWNCHTSWRQSAWSRRFCQETESFASPGTMPCWVPQWWVCARGSEPLGTCWTIRQ